MKLDFKDRVAIVTGAARGIGETTCWAFAKRGATAIVVDINGDGAEKVAADIRAKGLNAEAYTVDVSDRQAVDTMVENVFGKFGRIDVLVNNAYISGGYAIVTETAHEIWDKVIAVNLTGTFNFSKAVAAKMIPKKSGKIINHQHFQWRGCHRKSILWCSIPCKQGWYHWANIGFGRRPCSLWNQCELHYSGINQNLGT